MSGLGSLTNCLMDNDRDVLTRARKLRFNALVISLLLEAAMIAAMLLWPLITPGVIHRDVVWTPTPPYNRGGGVKPNTGRNPHPAGTIHHRPTGAFVYLPPQTPHRPVVSGEVEGQPVIEGAPDCIGNCDGTGGPGPFIPGATGDLPGIPDATHQPLHIDRPVSRSQGVMEASLIHRVQPDYPAIARFNHISGPVVLHAIIGTDGTIQQLEVVSGNSILAMAAVTAVRDWRYRPTLLSGNPVQVDTYITVNFVLE